MPHLFEQQVERSAEAIAVRYEEQQLTYAELNERANQLAHYLRALGVGPEVLVGICLPRSVELIVGLLGILKAGGAYLPLDPGYPAERLSFMLEDGQVQVLVTEEALLERLPVHWGQTICVDGEWERIGAESVLNPALASEFGQPGLCHLHLGVERRAEGSLRDAPGHQPAGARDRLFASGSRGRSGASFECLV